MCRTGGRRCQGSDSTHKARLRKRISRARIAIEAAHAAGDTTAAVCAALKLAAATAELDAINREHAAHDGDVTTPDQHPGHDQHMTVITAGHNHGIQSTNLGSVHMGPGGITITGGPAGDVTTGMTVLNANHGGGVRPPRDRAGRGKHARTHPHRLEHPFPSTARGRDTCLLLPLVRQGFLRCAVRRSLN